MINSHVQPVQSPAGGGVRITRRGRVLLVAALALLLFAAFSFGRVTSHAASPAARSHQVVVGAGENLWSLATRLAPDADPRVLVARIEILNHLRGAALQAGQSLLVPTAS